MPAVLLTIHIIACIVLVVAVMLQRSEGGALGMGGGGTGGLISGRGAASVLVRVTGGLALVFFTTSIVMTRLNNEAVNAPSVLEQQARQPVDPFKPAPVGQAPSPSSTTAPGAATTPPASTAPEAPAPAPAVDPLAPKTNSAPASNPPAPGAKPPASGPAPATTPPAAPAPAPQNGGSNN